MTEDSLTLEDKAFYSAFFFLANTVSFLFFGKENDKIFGEQGKGR